MNNRTRAWRRFQKFVKRKEGKHSKPNVYKSEKNRKLLYTRSIKLQRAKQLGIDYPKRTIAQIIESNE